MSAQRHTNPDRTDGPPTRAIGAYTAAGTSTATVKRDALQAARILNANRQHQPVDSVLGEASRLSGTETASSDSRKIYGGTAMSASPASIPGSPPKRPPRYGSAVEATYIDMIAGGQLAPGTKLPTEDALREAFGVSRSVIRESLRVLEEKGLVRVRHGHGTTVEPPEQWNLLDPQVLKSVVGNNEMVPILDDLILVRVALERQMTSIAATRMTDAELNALGEALATLAGLFYSPADYRAADRRFHDIILNASGNKLGRLIIESILPYTCAHTWYQEISSTPEHLAMTQLGHVAIYERLRARDGEGAGTAMRDHIMESWRNARGTVEGSLATLAGS